MNLVTSICFLFISGEILWEVRRAEENKTRLCWYICQQSMVHKEGRFLYPMLFSTMTWDNSICGSHETGSVEGDLMIWANPRAWYCTPDQVTIIIICLLYTFFQTLFWFYKLFWFIIQKKLRERLPLCYVSWHHVIMFFCRWFHA